MVNPGPDHWIALKWFFRYLKGSLNLGLCFKTCKEGVILKGFLDSHYAGIRDNRKSTNIFTVCGT